MDSDNSKNTSPSPEYYDDEIDLRDLILVLWNYRKFVLGIFLASLLIGAVISFAITPVYQVKAKMALGYYAVDPDNGQPLMTPETAREILLSSDFQEEAWGTGINAGVLNITPVEKTNILQITLETSDPEQGEVLLNKLITQLEEKTEEQYEKSIELLNKDLQNTDRELQEINKSIAHTWEILDNTSASQLEQAGLLDTLSRFLEQRDKLSERKLKTEQKLNSIEGMEVLKRPEAASSPMRPNRKLNIVVAGMLGLMVGVFMAFIVDYFRRKPIAINK